MDARTYRRVGAATVFSSLATGCMVGPNFEPPKLPANAGYTQDTSIPATVSSGGEGGAAQRFTLGGDIPAQWWGLFHSPRLDKLVKLTLAKNPDLSAAQAALRKAKELALAQAGTLWPAVGGQLNDTRTSESGAALGAPANYTELFSLTNAQVSVSYSPDVFGGQRRAMEAADASARYEAFQLEAARLTLTSNLVTAVIQEASLHGQIEATNEIILDQQRQVDLSQRQLGLGGASPSDVLAIQAQLLSTRSTLPPLERQLALVRDQIAALSGSFPSERAADDFSLDALHLPVDLPVSLPSDLVRQRPDVRSAEEQVHNASAELGVAIANQLPQFSLTGSYGAQSAGIPSLFTSASPAWSIGGSITQPIFQGGQLLHRRRAAKAQLEQAEAQYRSTLLTSFRNVADTLRSLSADAAALNAEVQAEHTAFSSLGLSRQKYDLGGLTYLGLLNAERTYQEAKIARIEAEAARFSDTAALFQALGGGWWHSADPQIVAAK